MFSEVQEVNVIHDDVIIATKTLEDQYILLHKIFNIIEQNNLTLNGQKCIFASQDIPFWGMRFTKDGIKPCSEKQRALQEMEPPKQKEDVASFLAMLQAHSKFIPLFSKLTENICNLQKKNVLFQWTDKHQHEFDTIKKYFRESTTLSHYDPEIPKWIFVDAAKGGLGAIIAQGYDINTTDIIAFSSCTTTSIEKRYPQIDLETMVVDFGLRRFRDYCVGAKNISVVMDHKPLKAIFENKRLGSIRIDRTKLCHQDINYKIVWRPGKLNPSNYLSRNSKISNDYIEEANEDTKLLYYLHNDQYVMNNITLKRIIDETKRDETIQSIINHLYSNTVPSELSYFKNINNELTVSAKGLLL